MFLTMYKLSADADEIQERTKVCPMNIHVRNGWRGARYEGVND